MNNMVKLFFHRIYKDFKKRELLPLKLLFFMYSSTIVVLYPYLNIHMRELGISAKETAMISAVVPGISIFMPLLAGMIADKIGNFRVLLSCFTIAGGSSALLLLLVPPGRITITYPKEIIVGLTCSPNQPLSLTLDQFYPCQPLSAENITIDTELQLQSCGYACHAILNENYTNTIMMTRRYDIQMLDIDNNSSLTYTYTLEDEDIQEPRLMSNIRRSNTLKNNQRYQTSIRKLSKNVLFFPAHSLFNFSCDIGNQENASCMMGYGSDFRNFNNKTGTAFNASLLIDEISHDDSEENRRTYFFNNIEGKHKTQCLENDNIKKKHITVTIPINNTQSKVQHLDLGSCSRKCLLTSPRANVCVNEKTVIELDMQLTFWTYLMGRVLVGIISGTSLALFEGAVIAILREHKADYGLQRIYSSVGSMISSPLSGWMIDFASRDKGYTDFRPIFFFYFGLKLVSCIIMLFINLEFKKAAASVVSEVLDVFKKVELIALLISCLLLGSAWGYIESFLFWLLEDLGGSKSLMGLTITVGGIFGIPLLVLSGPIIKKVGHANVIFLGFVFYTIRLVGYSLIYNPWLCLIFEAMETITFGLCFTAVVTYGAKLSTVTTDSSIQAMIGGLHYGVGKGVGSLVGGYLIGPIGIRHAFHVFAVFTLIAGITYFGFYHLYMKHRPSEGTEITKKDSLRSSKSMPNSDGLADPNLKREARAVPPVNFEDALCNPALAVTEDDVNNEEERRSTNGNGLA